MKVSELYQQAKDLMFEKKTSKDYDNFYIGWINQLLAELFDFNNNVLLANGEEMLEDIPSISKDTDDIPFDESVCRKILPWGLASYFYLDDDLQKYEIMQNKFTTNMAFMARAVEVKVEDVF